MILYCVKDWTRQGKLFIYWGLGKTNKADYFTKNHPPSDHIAMRHEYLHNGNHSIIFIRLQGIIDHVLVLTIHNMSHEPGGPKSNHWEAVGSMSDFITPV